MLANSETAWCTDELFTMMDINIHPEFCSHLHAQMCWDAHLVIRSMNHKQSRPEKFSTFQAKLPVRFFFV